MKEFTSGLPLTAAERAKLQPQLKETLDRLDSAVARKRRRKLRSQGFRQNYDAPATEETKRLTNRMLGERDEV